MTRAPRTIAAGRHDEILKRLAADATITVEDLAERLAVSRETIRRDLKSLAGRGRLNVVHGGATRRLEEPAFADRQSDNASGKAAIGRAAARLVEDGMVLLLDSGTTTLAIASALAGLDPDLQPRPAWKGLTVCTNSLTISLVLCKVPGIRVHLLGGEVSATDEAAFGIEAIEAIARYRGDIAFVGAGGITGAGEITDFAPIPTEHRIRLLSAAARSYVVADRTKFGRLTPLRVQPIPPGTAIIVDAAPPKAIAEAFGHRGMQVIVAA